MCRELCFHHGPIAVQTLSHPALLPGDTEQGRCCQPRLTQQKLRFESSGMQKRGLTQVPTWPHWVASGSEMFSCRWRHRQDPGVQGGCVGGSCSPCLPQATRAVNEPVYRLVKEPWTMGEAAAGSKDLLLGLAGARPAGEGRWEEDRGGS